MWKASAYGDFERLRALEAAAPGSLQRQDEQGYWALQWAALNNRVAIITHLVDEAGAEVGAADATGQTAAHWAAVRGSLAALETLLRAGADPMAPDSRGYTVCHVAAQYGQTQLLHRLALRWGADVDTPDADGRTPLHWAAYKGYAGGWVGRGWEGGQGGGWAGGWGWEGGWAGGWGWGGGGGGGGSAWNVERAQGGLHAPQPPTCLCPPPPTQPPPRPHPPLAPDTVRLLLLAGARPLLPDREGCTPLHWAAIRGNAEAATVLLQGGGEEALQAADATGNTPPQLALEKGHRLLGLHLSEHHSRQASRRLQKRAGGARAG